YLFSYVKSIEIRLILEKFEKSLAFSKERSNYTNKNIIKSSNVEPNQIIIFIRATNENLDSSIRSVNVYEYPNQITYLAI
ncbi:MAG: hypothetical protein WBL68_16985, partial [Nitrososphaeraceae archaeon]